MRKRKWKTNITTTKHSSRNYHWK